MTIFCVTEELAIRVGSQGIWIWAPSVSSQPIYLDRRRLEEMGLSLTGVVSSPSPIGRIAVSSKEG